MRLLTVLFVDFPTAFATPLRAMSAEESCTGREDRGGDEDFSREGEGRLSSSPEESPPARASNSASRSAMATAAGSGFVMEGEGSAETQAEQANCDVTYGCSPSRRRVLEPKRK